MYGIEYIPCVLFTPFLYTLHILLLVTHQQFAAQQHMLKSDLSIGGNEDYVILLLLLLLLLRRTCTVSKTPSSF